MSEPLIRLTEAARVQIASVLQELEKSGDGIRVSAEKVGPHRFRYAMDFVAPGEEEAGDQRVDAAGTTLWVDAESAELLRGTEIDHVPGVSGGFKFDNPQTRKTWDDPVAAKLQKLLDEEINPGIASHGGYVELLAFNDGIAKIHMGGGCQGCGMANVTLKEGIEKTVFERIPEVRELVDTTEHSMGSNPYC